MSWREHVQLGHDRAALLRTLLDPDRPRHFGILMDNVPEFSLLLGGAAFSGSVVVGLNTTRRGDALARDIALADCQVVFTERTHSHLLEGLDLATSGSSTWIPPPTGPTFWHHTVIRVPTSRRSRPTICSC